MSDHLDSLWMFKKPVQQLERLKLTELRLLVSFIKTPTLCGIHFATGLAKVNFTRSLDKVVLLQPTLATMKPTLTLPYLLSSEIVSIKSGPAWLQTINFVETNRLSNGLQIWERPTICWCDLPDRIMEVMH